MLGRLLKSKIEQADPAKRIVAVRELEADHPMLVQVAAEDADVTVRCAALERIDDLAFLGQRSQSDEDALARNTARERWMGVVTGQTSSAASLETRLADIQPALGVDVLFSVCRRAREAALFDAALDTLRSVSQPRDFEDLSCRIARSEAMPEFRRRAAAEVQSEVGLQRLVRDAKGHDKALYHDARKRLQAIRDQAAAAQQAVQLCEDMKNLHASLDDGLEHQQRPAFQSLAEAWRNLDKSGSDPALLAGFEERSTEVDAVIRAAEERHLQRIRAVEKLEGLRDGLLKPADPASGDIASIGDSAAELATLRAQWQDAAPPGPSEIRRYEEVCRIVSAEISARNRDSKCVARLQALLLRGEQLLESSGRADTAKIESMAEAWRKEAKPEDAHSASQLHDAFHSLLEKLRASVASRKENHARHLEQLNAGIADLDKALEQGQLKKATSLADRCKHLTTLLEYADRDSDRARGRLAALQPKLVELKRWQNWGADQTREELCKEATELPGQSLPPRKLANRISEMRDKWKKLDHSAGPARQALWERFDAACELAYVPCKAYFEQLSRQRSGNLQKREALCQQLEQLLEQTTMDQPDWSRIGEVIKETDKAWRRVGPVDRRAQKAVNKRFAVANKMLDQLLDPEREREVRRRRFAISNLTQMAERDDVESAMAAAKAAQRQWRPTVQADRKLEQALWEEFRGVCDSIFARGDERRGLARADAERTKAAKAGICAEISDLLKDTISGTESPADLEHLLNQARGEFDRLRKAWREAGTLPPKLARPLDAKYAAATRKFEQRASEGRHRVAELETELVRMRAALCLTAECTAVDRDSEDSQPETGDLISRWNNLPAIRGPVAKPLQKRFDRALEALEKGGDALDDLRLGMSDNLRTRENLCLRMEIVTGADSPPEFASERMRLKVARLTDSLAGAHRDSARESVTALAEQWLMTGPVPVEHRVPLEQRFQRACSASPGTAEN